MTDSSTFVGRMRRRVRIAQINSAIMHSLFSLGLTVFGLYLLAACTYCQNNTIAGYLLAASLSLGGIWWFVVVIRRVRRQRTPEGDPLRIQFQQFGDPEDIAREVDRDFTDQPFRMHRIYIGERWLCYAWKTQVRVCRIDTLVWAYMERVRHKLNYIIPIGTTNQMLAWNRDGSAAALPVRRKKNVVLALEALHHAAPWLYIGYSEVLKESWNNDRPELIAGVDHRHNEELLRRKLATQQQS